MSKQIRVLLAGGDEETRGQLVRILGEEEIVVVGTARSTEEVQAGADRLSPDVVLVLAGDETSDRSIIDTAGAISAAGSPATMIIITETPLQHLAPTIKAGANGLLAKGIGRDKLLSAIRKIYLWSPSYSCQ